MITSQLIFSFLGAIGFSMRCHLRKGLILPASFGGLLGWGIYLLCKHGGQQGIFVSCLIASICVSVYAEVLARVLKAPATVFLIPGAIPLIPGRNLYYAMSSAVSNEWSLARMHSVQMIQFALGIAIGISLIMAIFSMKENIKKERLKKKTEQNG